MASGERRSGGGSSSFNLPSASGKGVFTRMSSRRPPYRRMAGSVSGASGCCRRVPMADGGQTVRKRENEPLPGEQLVAEQDVRDIGLQHEVGREAASGEHRGTLCGAHASDRRVHPKAPRGRSLCARRGPCPWHIHPGTGAAFGREEAERWLAGHEQLAQTFP